MASRSTAKNEEPKAAQADAPEETPTVVSQPANPQLPQTVTDADGIERIIRPAGRKWEPAPVDPDPEKVKRLEAFNKAQEEQAKERQSSAAERAEKDEES